MRRSGRRWSALLALVTLLLVVGSACWTQGVEQRFAFGLELLFENRYEDAESHFLALARDMDRSDLPDAQAWRAKALFYAGRIDHLYLDQPRRAVSRLRQALKLHPEAAFAFDARREIGLIFHDRLMDYRTAAMEFERLVHEYPERSDIDSYQYRVAQCYFLLHDFDQARTEARLLLEKWPGKSHAPESRLLIANSYYLEGRHDEAVKAHKELLATGPDVPIRARSLFELGMCYQDLGDKQRAEKSFLDALKDHPRPDLVQMQLSALRTQIGAEDEKAKPLNYATAPTPPREKASAPKPSPKAEPKPKPTTKPKPTAKPSAAPDAKATGESIAKPASKEPAEGKKPKSAPDEKPAGTADEGKSEPPAKPAPKPAPEQTPKAEPPASEADPGPTP